MLAVVIRILPNRLGWIAVILLLCCSRMKFSCHDRDSLLFFICWCSNADFATRSTNGNRDVFAKMVRNGKGKNGTSDQDSGAVLVCLCALCTGDSSTAKLLTSHGARGNNVSKPTISQKSSQSLGNPLHIQLHSRCPSRGANI